MGVERGAGFASHTGLHVFFMFSILRLRPWVWCMVFNCAWLGESPGQTPPTVAGRARDYVLQALDRISVRIHDDPTLDREVRISREHRINLPLIGTVDLKGLSVAAAEARIAQRYDEEYLVNPQVNLLVLEYARRSVNVLGSVQKPGEVAFPREDSLTLLSAVAGAGGFTRSANRAKVRISRLNAEGRMESQVFNVDRLIKGDARAGSDPVLQRGDTVWVPDVLSHDGGGDGGGEG